MSYIDSNLIAGETIAYQTKLHWVVMLGHLLLGLVLMGISGTLLTYAFEKRAGGAVPSWIEDISAVLAGCGLLVILAGAMRRYSTEMAVTTRRVVVKKGLLSRSTIEMLLNKVESIEVRESAVGRLLGYGTVVLIGTGGSSEPFANMAHPLEFRSQVQQQLEAHPAGGPGMGS